MGLSRKKQKGVITGLPCGMCGVVAEHIVTLIVTN